MDVSVGTIVSKPRRQRRPLTAEELRLKDTLRRRSDLARMARELSRFKIEATGNTVRIGRAIICHGPADECAILAAALSNELFSAARDAEQRASEICARIAGAVQDIDTTDITDYEPEGVTDE